MTIETFMTNVIILLIENQLITQLPEVFQTDKLMDLSKEQLEWLAEESEDVHESRAQLTAEVTALKQGLELCEQWRRDNKGELTISLNPVLPFCSD